jgi:hypothetical protein
MGLLRVYSKSSNDRLKQNYFGHQTKTLLNALSTAVQEKLISSFQKYLSSIIEYINKYYNEHSSLAEVVATFLECIYNQGRRN